MRPTSLFVFVLSATGLPVCFAERDPIVGDWRWIDNQTITIAESGRLTSTLGTRGEWKAISVDSKSRCYEFNWGQGRYIDRIQLSANGNRLTGTNQSGRNVTGTRLMTTPSAAPVGDPKGAQGLAIWVEEDGKMWHFRSHSAKNEEHKFIGTIEVAGARITGATGIASLEAKQGDFWKMDLAKNKVDFCFVTVDRGDRVDLVLNHPAASIICDVQEDGHPIKPNRICLGAAREHPTSSHFAVPGK